MAAKPSYKAVKAVAASRARGAALTTPSQAPNIGAKLSTSKPRSTGASLGGLKAAKPPAPAPTRTAPAAPAAPAAPTAPPPFLTPAEAAAWQKFQGDYAAKIGNINPDSLAGAAPDQITQALINGGGTLGQQLASGQSQYTSGLGTAQHTHDVNADTTNQMTAARGLFQSSIRDGDLNDIDATLATRQSTLNTAWGGLQTRIGTAYDTAVRDYGTTAAYYSGLSVENGAASDSGLPGSSTGTSTTSGAAAAGAAPTASQPRAPTAPPMTAGIPKPPPAPKPPRPTQPGTASGAIGGFKAAAPPVGASMTFGGGR